MTTAMILPEMATRAERAAVFNHWDSCPACAAMMDRPDIEVERMIETHPEIAQAMEKLQRADIADPEYRATRLPFWKARENPT